MKNIAVFFGGESAEREVSVITGVLTLNSLDKTKYNPVPVFITEKGKWYTGALNDLDAYKNLNLDKLKPVTLISGQDELFVIKNKTLKRLFKINCAINCIHGSPGEDGSLKGLLNLCKIPLVGCSVAPAGISMDKYLTKLCLKGLEIPVLDSVLVCETDNLDNISLPFNYPALVKPNGGGSSIGVKVANSQGELPSAIRFALRYDKKAIIEPCLTDFTEINCAGYMNAEGEIICSSCEKPIGKSEILSFQDKYENGTREFPAKIDKLTSSYIQNTTKTIYSKLGFNGVIRIDYFLYGKKVFVNEINSVPGSMAYYLFCNTLKEFSSQLDCMIVKAIKDQASSETLNKTFKSNILKGCGGKSAKRL